MYQPVLQESQNSLLEFKMYNVMSKESLNQSQLTPFSLHVQLTLLTFVKNKHHAQIFVDQMDFA